MPTTDSRVLDTRHAGLPARVTTAMLLALAATLLVACRNGNRDAPGTVGDTSAVDTSAPPAATSATDPITDIVVVVVADRLPLVGRQVALSGVRVQTVTGDRTFWVGPDPSRQLFVVLNERRMPGADSSTVVRPGQTVTVSGVVRALPADLSTMRREWSLSAANIQTLGAERVYLAADRVEVTAR